MATLNDVRRMALALPETSEQTGGHDATRRWLVKGKPFVWERPLRKTDLAALGLTVQGGIVLAAWVDDEDAKSALVAEGGPFFTTPHFDRYAIVLIRLDDIAGGELAEMVTDAWLCRAPVGARKAYLGGQSGPTL